jgi:HlyD family secretion protein
MEQAPVPAKSRRKKNPWPKRLILTALLLAAGAGVVVAMQPKPLEVEVASARRGLLLVTVNEDGVTRVTDRFVVSAPLSGNVARIELHAGESVKQGDVVARILPLRAPLLDARSRSEAEARVNASIAALAQSRAQIDRARVARDYAVEESENARKLEKTGTLSRQALDRALVDERSRAAELASAEFAARVAENELTMARAALGRMSASDAGEQFEVTSPVSGRVLRVVQVSEGVVQAGTNLLEVGDPSALEIAVDVLTSDAVHVLPGARVTIDEWGGEPLSATVRMIEPSAFTRLSALGVEEQRVNAVMDVVTPYEAWKALGDGYRVAARIEVYRSEDSLMIPWSALFRRGPAWAVFTVSEGVAHLRPVKIGRRNEIDAEVLDGLAGDARVILHPSDKISEGTLVVAR